MTDLQSFCFRATSVRILGTPEEPLFVARDVLEAIGSTTKVTDIKNMVVEGLGEEFVINEPLETAGGKQNFLCLTEPALTFFISRSRTELGKKFNRWIHGEVLPTIRKTGTYSTEPFSEKLAIEREKTKQERIKAQSKIDLERLKHENKLAEVEYRRSQPKQKTAATSNSTSSEEEMLDKIIKIAQTCSSRGFCLFFYAKIRQRFWENFPKPSQFNLKQL